MKYIILVVSFICIILILALSGFNYTNECQIEYLRIHIRANSNSVEDQTVKYKVKDAVVEALIPYLSDVQTFDEAVDVVSSNFSLIESVANDTLSNNGFFYKSRAEIKNEFFPTRTYEDITLQEGYYDALILNLGSGEGDNWWCIVFPAFCFTKTKKSDNLVYISQIWEIIKNVIQNN